MEDTDFALELAWDLRGARGNFVIKVGEITGDAGWNRDFSTDKRCEWATNNI